MGKPKPLAFTRRELAILDDLRQGYSSREIASRRRIDARVVKTTIQDLNHRYETLSVTELLEQLFKK